YKSADKYSSRSPLSPPLPYPRPTPTPAPNLPQSDHRVATTTTAVTARPPQPRPTRSGACPRRHHETTDARLFADCRFTALARISPFFLYFPQYDQDRLYIPLKPFVPASPGIVNRIQYPIQTLLLRSPRCRNEFNAQTFLPAACG